MHTTLSESWRDSESARDAAAIVGRCVHCGFCLATCPTYQVLGDERDSPRGRIYLIKELLETGTATAAMQTHLDRCLGCRACETTCPSGVRYGELLDFGRAGIERQRERPLPERALRLALRRIVPARQLFAALLAIAKALAPVLPRALRRKLPLPTQRGQTQATIGASAPAATTQPTRRMLLLDVCAESATPATRASTRRVFARFGIALETVDGAGCCGALAYHMGRHDEGLAAMRRNIDAWWPQIEGGAEAIVITATGCGASVRDYGHLLRHDGAYAEKAQRIAELARDPAEVIAAEMTTDHHRAWLAGLGRGRRVAFHAPCSLQHALHGAPPIEKLLCDAGYTLVPMAEPQLCCGSAGSYSILQPALADELRRRKLAALEADAPDVIATANIGCQLHLAAGTTRPLRHWIELLDNES